MTQGGLANVSCQRQQRRAGSLDSGCPRSAVDSRQLRLGPGPPLYRRSCWCHPSPPLSSIAARIDVCARKHTNFQESHALQEADEAWDPDNDEEQVLQGVVGGEFMCCQRQSESLCAPAKVPLPAGITQFDLVFS